ncbi:MAG: S8 family serine peptidase [Planctomycetales bacterium]|nr:S8 family serine peptidase [Planctomycetales bacterium]
MAVNDSGIHYTHPDLAGDMWSNPGEIPGNGIEDDTNGWIDDVHGYDFSDLDANIIDDDASSGGHGSHVSGTIGAIGNNGVGVAGVNWDVSLMGMKIFPNANLAAVVGAVNYATTMRQTFNINITAINASYRALSTSGGSQLEKDSIAAVNAAGVVFVAAAGNDSINNDGTWRAYPASYDLDGIISVAAPDDRALRSSFSNYGVTTVDLGAPGGDQNSGRPGILSTVPTSVNSTGYISYQGTSMAAPQVSGVVALLRGMRPSLSVQQTKDAILNTVDSASALSGITVTGGRLNLAAAVTEVAGNVVVSARESLTTNLNDDGTGDEFIVKRDGTDLVLTIDSLESDRVTYSSVTGVAILGSADDDTLTIDHTGGVIDVPVIYTAFDGANTLQVIGDLDYTLSNTELISPGAGNVELAYVDSVELTGGASANTIDASAFTAGLVVLNGEGGNDSLLGSTGNDALNGADGDDTFVGGDGNDTLAGGSGIDQLHQSADANQVLIDSTATGLGTDSISAIEEAWLVGGISDNSLDASAFAGSVTLQGLAGNDSLWGATGNDSLDGGDDTDQIHQVRDADQVLTNTLVTGDGNDTLSSIEQAQLTAGGSNNTLDASGFDAGPVTLDGAGGDDTLLGSASDDSLEGGPGTDQLRQTADADHVLTDTSVSGHGSDQLVSIEQAVLTGGATANTLDARDFSGTVTLAGLAADDTLWGAAGNDSLDGGGGDDLARQQIDANQILVDTLVTGDGDDTLTGVENGWLIAGSSNNTMDADGFTLGSTTLEGAGGDDTLTGSGQGDSLAGGAGTDLLIQNADTQQVLTDSSLSGRGNDAVSGIELAHLTGGNSDNRIDASLFSGTVTLSGGAGHDTLLAAAGDDSVDGGTGTDEIRQTADADQVLLNTSLTGDGNDTLNSIERAELTGGSSNNTLDPSGFTLGPVTLLGLAGNDTLHGSSGNDLIDGGTGSDQVRQTVDSDQAITDTSLSGQGSDQLVSIEQAILTGGAGDNDLDAGGFSAGPVTLVGAAGNDTLTGTSTSDTLDGGDDTDTGRVIFDGNLVLTNSTVVGPGNDTLVSIEHFTITGGSGNNRFDASAYTLGSVTLDGADGDDTLLGSNSDDTLIGGTGTDTVEQTVDGNQVLSDSSLTGSGSDALSGIEHAILTGGASDNLIDAGSFNGLGVTLTGGNGNDTLLGSAGNDSLDGGNGIDLGGQASDTNQVATNTSLAGDGTDVLAGIEEILLTGGAGDNRLDATGFTAGPATLSGGNGNDTLLGTASSDSLNGGDGTDMVVQVTGSNQVLTNTTLTGLGLDVLAQVEEASLTGDSQDNQIDASAFTAGPVNVSGLLGDDTITGSSSDDTLDGGDGLDVLTQASDSDQVLTNTTLTGHGNDTHSSFERVQLTGGVGDNLLDAGSYTIGVVTLDGDDGNDTLIGGQGDDTLVGGDGTDQVEQLANGDQVLTNTQLTGRGVDTLSSIESGRLSGGSSANLLTAETFTHGPVTLDGGSGDDTLVGSPASDSLAGGSGTDRVRQTVDNDQVATDTQLTGHGTDVLTSIENLELIGGPSANRLNTSTFTRGSTTLLGAGGDDTLLGSAANDSLDGGTGNDQVEQYSDADQVLTSSTLTGRGNDLLAGIELAVLTGGPGDNTIDATGFDSGDTTLTGSDGDDTLLGSSGDDQIEGGPGTDLVVSTGDFDHVLSATSVTGAGNDTLVDIETAHISGGDSANTIDASGFAGDTTLEGGDGDDTLLGGSGVDLVLQTADADQLLTTTTLTGLGQNTLSNIDQAKLIGGDGSNRLDASAFTPGPVTLDGAGGDDTLLGSAGDDQITGGAGSDLIVSTGTANQVLSDTLLQADSDDVLSGIELAELHGSSSDNLIDASAFSGNTTLHGSSGDDTLAGGTGSDLLRQTVDADQSLTDSQLTGNGNDVISGIEFAWLTGGGSDNTIDARDFSSGPVTLDGAAGNDTLVGGSGDDRLIGADGIDQVQQQSDVDQVLTDSLLTGSGNDEIDGIEEAQLSGGSGDNLLDATAFNNGPVTLSGLDGNDTLRGSAGNDSLSGGDGLDRVEQTIDADQTLSNTQLVGRGTDGLDAVETAHLVGGSSNNVISASLFTLGQVTLDGAAGDDNLIGGSQDDSIIAGDGNDVANGRGGNDMMSGGDGNDDFTGGGGDDTMLGEAGNDSLNGQGGRDSILGADGDDWLYGNGSPDTVTGGRGNDQVLGGASGDVLNGSSGNDTVDGGDGSDRVFGGSGTDMLDGGDGADRLNGQGGSGDVVLGNDGDDTVQGGSGNDLLDGGPGYDELRESGNVDFLLEDTSLAGQGTDEISSLESARLTGGRDANVIDASGFSGPVTLRGSGGDDLLRSSSFDDLLLGGNGDDTLESGSGLDTLEGGTGTDRVKVSGDGDFVITDATFTGPATTSSMAEIEAVDILAGPGDNILDASNFTGNTTLWGGGGRDVITGGIGNDWLNGNDGEDQLTGGGGIDLMHGGAGSDLLFGGDGDDTINGEAGDDTIDGGGGNDYLVGEDGHDRLLGRDGDDSLYGGTGNDELLGHAGRDRLNGESGNDTLLGDLDPDTLWGGNGNDVISGDDDNDRLYGQSGNDTLLGAAGDDRMQGGSDRDVLSGGDGDDTLNGQKDYDTLMGGDGRDRFNSFDSTAVVNELFALPDELFTAIDRVRNG